jgi:hypothetical protein
VARAPRAVWLLVAALGALSIALATALVLVLSRH